MRALRRVIVGLLTACLLCAPADPGRAQISIPDLKNGMVQFLLRQIGEPGAFEVTAGSVSEVAAGVTAMNDVRVADREGVWLTVRQVSFSWNASALLKGRVEIGRLQIDGLRMLRLSGDPELKGGELAKQQSASEPFSWPRSPITLRVGALEMRDAWLSDRVLRQAIRFDAVGAAQDEGDAQLLRLKISRRDAVKGVVDLAYDRRFAANSLKLRLEAQEAAGGIVAAIAGLPRGGASQFSLRGEGPPSDWRLTLSASSQDVFSLQGGGRVAYESPVAADLDFRLTPGAALSTDVRRALSPQARLKLRASENAEGVIRIEQARVEAADLTASLTGAYKRVSGALDGVLNAEARRGLGDLIPGVSFQRLELRAALATIVKRIGEGGGEADRSSSRFLSFVTLDQRPNVSKASLQAKATGLRVGPVGARGGPVFDILAKGDWKNGQMIAVLTAENKGAAAPLEASLSLPLRPAPDGGVVAPMDEPIKGSLVWRGEVSDLWSLVPAPDHLLSGRMNVDLSLGGALSKPALGGQADLQRGRYENLALGAILNDIAARVAVKSGSRLSLTLDAKAGAGRAGVKAALDFARLTAPSIEAEASLSRALLTQRDDFSATVSGKIAATGRLFAPHVAGRVNVEEAELRLIAAPAAEIPDLGPVSQAGGSGASQRRRDAGSARKQGGGATLDLAIDAPRQLYVRGRGLDSEWRASLRVKGPASSPRVSGAVQKVRGWLDLLGRRFELSKGLVDFSGAAKPDPRLDVVFTRKANDIEGFVRLGGVASAPRLSFSSVPGLPQQEVLPRLLFGRSTMSLSATEAAQLASGVATLTSGEAGVLEKARKLSGLDVLDYGETSGGGEALTAGRYVGEGAFVGARQSLDGKGGAAVVELEVTQGVSVDAEVGREGGSSVGATWRFDF